MGYNISTTNVTSYKLVATQKNISYHYQSPVRLLLRWWYFVTSSLAGLCFWGKDMVKRNRRVPEDYHNLAKEKGFIWVGPEVFSIQTKTGWQCGNGHEWLANFSNIRSGWGCPRCSGKFPKKPEDYYKLAEVRGFQWLGPEVNRSMVKTFWECSFHHQWQATYSKIKSGSGCPYCYSKNIPKTENDYYKLAERVGFQWLGPMVRRVVYKTKWECSNLHQFLSRYNDIDQGYGCPYCAGCISKTPEDYYNLAKLRNFEWLGPSVKTNRTPTEWRCKWNHHWMSNYYNIATGHGCPKCDQSKGEDAISKFLDRLNIMYQIERRFDDCRNIHPLPFDFCIYIDKIMILIEFDGEQHIRTNKFFGGEEKLKKRQLHDQIKNAYAAKNNIPLIRIPYTVKSIESYLKFELEKHLGYSLDTLRENNYNEVNYSRIIGFNPYAWQQLRLI